MALTTWDEIVAAREQIAKDRSEIERVMAESVVEDVPNTQPDAGLDERVQRGAAWLDGEIPDWADMINLKTFSIKSSCNCVLGQIGKKQGTSNYELTAERYFGVGNQYGGKVSAMGFYTEQDGNEWNVLQESWERAIAARQTK